MQEKCVTEIDIPQRWDRAVKKCYFRTPHSLIDAIENAPLLSRCGGPYPQIDWLQVVNKKDALDKMTCYLLDSTAQLCLDKRIGKAESEACFGLEAPFVKRILTAMALSKEWWQRRWYDRRLTANGYPGEPEAQKHDEFKGEPDAWAVPAVLLELFLAVGHLVIFSKVEEFPELAAVSVVALKGYLPTDIRFSGADMKVLTY